MFHILSRKNRVHFDIRSRHHFFIDQTFNNFRDQATRFLDLAANDDLATGRSLGYLLQNQIGEQAPTFCIRTSLLLTDMQLH